MYKLSATLPDSLSEIQAVILGQATGDLCLSHSAIRRENLDDAPWVFEWLNDSALNAKIIEARLLIAADIHNISLPPNFIFTTETLEDRDWLAYSYKQFPPFDVGEFTIYGSHSTDCVPDGQIGLQIDAATAFGSGEHGTTAGCLTLMLALKEKGACPWNVLDMGSGSGILAIAAWKLWKTPVLAVDNDDEAVRVADHHRAINHVPQSKTDMLCVCGNGFNEATTQKRKPYDLVIANILAATLKIMVKDLMNVMDDNGYVILSGILNEQAEDVISVYENAGLVLRETLIVGEWSSLLMQNAAT